MRYTDTHIKTKSCKLCIFNPYSFRVYYPWNLSSFLKHSLLFNTFNSFNVNIESYPINKYLIKGEFFLRGIKLWDFIFDKGLFQQKGEKSCLFSRSIWQDTKQYMLSRALGLPENMSHRSVLALEVQDFS